MSIKFDSTDKLNADVQKDKIFFNNKRISNVILNGHTDDNGSYGVILENMKIRNLTLENIQMRRAHFKNVAFIDCAFVKVDFSYSKFENVKFIRGEMSGYDRQDNFEDYKTDFHLVEVDNILFDSVEIGKSVNINFHNGIVVMKNVKVVSSKEKSSILLGGSNIHTRIDNCIVKNQYGLSIIGDDSSACITNSSFINSDIKVQGKAAWIENCILSNSSTPSTSTLVIKNSKLNTVSVRGAGRAEWRIFLVDNIYNNPADTTAMSLPRAKNKIKGENAHVYLYADTKIPGTLVVNGGNVNIFGAEIDNIFMIQQRLQTYSASLNLQNVIIKNGDWELADVRQGKWENVHIYLPVDVKDAKFGKIIGYNVEFPQGPPWSNGKLDIVNSPEPLEFDRAPVPTLEELGLAQFWRKNDFSVEEY
ncbi:MAG: hypothetical protein LBC94_05890 [Desulfovibrio sp.]|jgi:uncharacterized protein YjbI with pentapeptide repeats|nr:hypothetical protein [Desulfovibrio sp.]